MKVDYCANELKKCLFGELSIGDCFLDDGGEIGIKTDHNSYISTLEGEWWDKCSADPDDTVTLLEATLTV